MTEYQKERLQKIQRNALVLKNLGEKPEPKKNTKINNLEDRNAEVAKTQIKNRRRRSINAVEEWSVEEDVKYPKVKQGRNILLQFLGYYEGKKSNLDLIIKMKVPESECQGWISSQISPESAVERSKDETKSLYPTKFLSDWTKESLDMEVNASPILEISAERLQVENNMRACEPREKLEMYKNFPNVKEFFLHEVEKKLQSPLTKDNAKEELRGKKRVATKIHTCARKWESFFTLFFVFIKEHYGREGFKGWSSFFSKKLVLDFLNCYSSEQISTRNNMAKNFQIIIKFLRRNDNYFLLFCNTSTVVMHALGSYREKRSSRDAHISNRPSHTQKIEMGKAISETEKNEMFKKSIRKMEKILQSKDKEKYMTFQKILLCCMSWSCAIQVVQRRQVLESLTTDNVYFDKKSNSFALVVDIAEKTVRKISTDKVPLFWPSMFSKYIRFYLVTIHPKIAQAKVNGFWVSKKGNPVQGETLARWFKEQNMKLTGKDIGFLEARHNASSLISIRANKLPLNERTEFLETMTSYAGHSVTVFDKNYNENKEEEMRIEKQVSMNEELNRVIQNAEMPKEKRRIDITEANLSPKQFEKMVEIFSNEDFVIFQVI
jgi:hypothetical protein